MTGRVRHVSENKIVLWLKTPIASKSEYCTLEEIKQHFGDYAELLNHTRLVLREGVYVWVFEETWENLTECYNVLEDNRKKCHFLTELGNLCKANGYKIVDDRHKKRLSPELQAAAMKVKALSLRDFLLADGDPQACSDHVQCARASSTDKLVVTKYRIQYLRLTLSVSRASLCFSLSLCFSVLLSVSLCFSLSVPLFLCVSLCLCVSLFICEQ